ALVPQLLGHMSLNWALSFLPATMVAVAILGEPVGAMILASVVLSETPVVLEIAGSLLILCGIGFAFVRGGLGTK
ncbi:MAG: EamA family transporter, partial [Dehalococcoidia bacterium]|nr:EamA family transporter [Dehalococcoidia bacterium]